MIESAAGARFDKKVFVSKCATGLCEVTTFALNDHE